MEDCEIVSGYSVYTLAIFTLIGIIIGIVIEKFMRRGK